MVLIFVCSFARLANKMRILGTALEFSSVLTGDLLVQLRKYSTASD
jgi:hypothetical protein